MCDGETDAEDLLDEGGDWLARAFRHRLHFCRRFHPEESEAARVPVTGTDGRWKGARAACYGGNQLNPTLFHEIWIRTLPGNVRNFRSGWQTGSSGIRGGNEEEVKEGCEAGEGDGEGDGADGFLVLVGYGFHGRAGLWGWKRVHGVGFSIRAAFSLKTPEVFAPPWGIDLPRGTAHAGRS